MDEREMKNTIPGIVEVDEGVIQDMVGYVAMTNYGVAGMAAPSLTDGLAKMLPSSKLRRGIVVRNNGESVSVELYIIVQYGTNISAVAENLSEAVRWALEEYLQIPVDDVFVKIQGVKS